MNSYSDALTVPMSSDLMQQISKVAASEGLSVNEFVRSTMSIAIEQLQFKMLVDEITQNRSSEEILANYDAVMAKMRQRPPLPDEEIPEWDRMPE